MLPTPLYRRFGALVYDFLLHLSLWIIVTGIFSGVVLKWQVLGPEHRWILQVTLLPLLILISFSFCSYFWLRNQQTLGMQAWRLKLVGHEGEKPNLTAITLRFGLTWLTLGIGTLWCLFDRDKRALQDIISPTRMVYTP